MSAPFPPPRGLTDDAARLRSGALDPVVHVGATVDAMEAHDPVLQAFVREVDVRGRLCAEARQAARRWPAPTARPALFGVPVGVKDVIRVDGLPTTAGSRVPPEVLAGREATVVRRLRAAGALVAGKTVTAEFAHAAPGPTRNPHALDHTPGGSSSGSAAAVAAGLVALAVGTQTVGSTIRPAAFCGVVGFCPTSGRIPVDGLIANAPSFDAVGLFTRAVADMSLAASAVVDGWVPASPPGQAPVVGVPEGPYLDLLTPEGATGFAAQLRALRAAGVEVRAVPMFADLEAVMDRQISVGRFELARTHARWFAEHGSRYHELTAAAVRQGQAIAVEEYDAAVAACAVFRAGLVARMDAEGIDAWVAPSAAGPAPEGLAGTGSPAMSLPWSQAGLPAVSVPAGTTAAGLPLGLQCVGRPGADEQLLALAAVLEPALTRTGGLCPAAGRAKSLGLRRR